MKTDVERVVNAGEFTYTGSEHKHIIIFNITAMNSDMDGYTNSLVSKLNTFAKANNMDVSVGMSSASKIDSKGQEADIILLNPELFAMQDEIQIKYPNKTVRVIDKKDYGLLQVENIFKTALS